MLTLFLNQYLDEEQAKVLMGLPVEINLNVDYYVILSKRLNSYYNKLSEIAHSQNDISIACELDLFSFLGETKSLVDGILFALKTYIGTNSWDEGYRCFKRTLDKIDRNFITNNTIPLSTDKYYRIRKNKNSEKVSDLYHISFNNVSKVKNGRFNRLGCPCLYLSFSMDACVKEMTLTPRDMLGSFELKNSNSELKLFNMTELIDQIKKKGEFSQLDSFDLLWPLFAACYTICSEDEESPLMYIIPQMFAYYVRNEYGLDGIQYYTVRDENLNPAESKMKNVVLFTTNDGLEYDYNLLDKFDISIVQ